MRARPGMGPAAVLSSQQAACRARGLRSFPARAFVPRNETCGRYASFGAGGILLPSAFLFCSYMAMRYLHAATRPFLPDDTVREAALAFVLGLPAFWAVGELAVALGY